MLSEAKHPATSMPVEFQWIPKVATVLTLQESSLVFEVAGFFSGDCGIRMTLRDGF
jgi:hypothetical protein